MKIEEVLDIVKFPTRHLKDTGIKKIRELQDSIEDDEKFMSILVELCDKEFWLSVTTKDLYYWIVVLNKVDQLFEDTIKKIQNLGNGTFQVANQEEFNQAKAEAYDRLKILLCFSANLMKDCNSRSIYSSTDRVLDIMREVDSFELIYLCLDLIYFLIRKCNLNGKFTKAHDFRESDILKLVYIWSNGFHFFTNKHINMMHTSKVDEIITSQESKNHILKTAQRIRETLLNTKASDSSRNVSESSVDNAIMSFKNITTILEKRRKNENYSVEPYIMRLMIGSQILDEVKGEENLFNINKLVMKAKSVFIQLSTVEEELFYTEKFIRNHPFSIFIPDIIKFLTEDHPNELHELSIEVIHSYL